VKATITSVEPRLHTSNLELNKDTISININTLQPAFPEQFELKNSLTRNQKPFETLEHSTFEDKKLERRFESEKKIDEPKK
jgi:hypothetical protein